MWHRCTLRPLALVASTAVALTVTACSSDSSSTSSGTSPRDSSSSTSTVGPESPEATSETADGSTDLITDVEIDGRRIHVTCFGPTDTSEPTVLFEAGAGSSSDTWDSVVDALSTTHRACSYDRAGTGASPLPPQPRRTTKDIVADLETVLGKAQIDGPFVLVGHSFAVWPLSVFAAAHPEDVAGVVLVDPRGPHVSARWLAALPPPSAGEPKAVRLNREELTVFEHDPKLNREHLDVARSAAEASDVLDAPGPLFGDAPLLVLGAVDTHLSWSDLPPRLATAFDRIWLDEQKALVHESTNGTFHEVADSRHEIQSDQPEAVIDAVESVLASAAD
jgi:pimeloyl-ACP methyl ester carboxylesterase